jgi:FkbM family methyltransferase
MKLIERIKLLHRANKYRNKDDKGGITYINSAVKKGQTVLDIGAHKAGYLYFFQGTVGREGRVYGFEPQSNLYEYLVKIKKLFGWDHVTIEHLALSDKAGSVQLFIPKNKVSQQSSPGATIVQHEDQSAFGKTETVTTETLDSYCERNNIQPDFLKIDVEGNELRVLQGGINAIKKYKPKMIVEIEARHVGEQQVLDTFGFMQSLGYSGYIVHGLERIPLSAFSFSKHQDVNNPSAYCNNFIFEMQP